MFALKTRVATAIVGGAVMGLLSGGCGQSGGGGVTGAGGGGSGTGGAGGDAGPIQPASGDYQPLTVGATWTYHVNDKGVQFDKIATVEGMEDIGGAKAGVIGIKMRESMPGESQLTWYQRVGTMVVRHHEQGLNSTQAVKSDQWFDPYRLRIDETPDHLTVGAAWDFSYVETASSPTKPTATTPFDESWTVDAVDEPVAVPAGNFPALKLTHVDPTDSSTKTYWFVRGVGKVREQTSGGHIEELASYQVPPAS